MEDLEQDREFGQDQELEEEQETGGLAEAMADRVEALLVEELAHAGFRLMDVEYRQEGRWVLRLFMVRESGGLTLDDCAAASELASRLLDVADPIPHEYGMEVSSPGIFRKLSKPRHFSQSIGQVIRVKLKEEAVLTPGHYVLRGELSALEDETLVMVVEDEQIRIPLSGVKTARLDPDLKADLNRS